MKLDRTIIKSLSLFDKMTDDELDALLVPAQTRRLPIGESVFEQGQPATYFFLLLHGRLKVTQVTSAGQQIIVRVVHPGDLFGFAPDQSGQASGFVALIKNTAHPTDRLSKGMAGMSPSACPARCTSP